MVQPPGQPAQQECFLNKGPSFVPWGPRSSQMTPRLAQPKSRDFGVLWNPSHQPTRQHCHLSTLSPLT